MSNEQSPRGRAARFLRVKVRLKDGRKGIHVPLPPIALFAPYYLLLSLEPLVSLAPGHYGVKARAALDAAMALMLGLMACGPQELVDVDVRDGNKLIRVLVRTF